MSEPTRLKRNSHPAGNAHWTRQPGVQRAPWGKLKPEKRAELTRRYLAGESQGALASEYRIGRTTVWRYLRKQGLVKIKAVSSVSRVTISTNQM